MARSYASGLAGESQDALDSLDGRVAVLAGSRYDGWGPEDRGGLDTGATSVADVLSHVTLARGVPVCDG